MKRLLITGSSGTIGTELLSRVSENPDYHAVCVDKRPNRWIEHRSICHDLTQPGIPELGDIDIVVHLAANARVHELVKHPYKAQDNITTTFNALEIARAKNADFIFASSREVYGELDAGDPVTEDNVNLQDAESPYTASKMAGESLVKSYDRCYDMDTTIVRFSNVYGKYDISNRVVPLFIAQASHGKDLTVYGEDKTLDFTYVEDAVDGLLSVINTPESRGETYNLAYGTGHKLIELASVVAQHIDNPVSVNTEPNRNGEITWYVADISKAEQELGYSPSVNFADGVKKTIDWYAARPHLYKEIMS